MDWDEMSAQERAAFITGGFLDKNGGVHGVSQRRETNAETMQDAYQQLTGGDKPLSLERARQKTYERVKVEYEGWGYTAQEASDVLAGLFSRAGVTIAPEPVGDSSDGIAPCGYDELMPYLLGKERYIEE